MAESPIVAEIRLSNGETYTVTREGWIGRPGAGVAPSADWRITGARAYNNFGNQIGYYTLTDLLTGRQPQWRHKNGKPRAYLQDWDHGTHREQRSPHVIWMVPRG